MLQKGTGTMASRNFILFAVPSSFCQIIYDVLSIDGQKALDIINSALLEIYPVDAQNLSRSRVIIARNHGRVITTLHLLRGKLIFQLREVLTRSRRNVTIAEIARSAEETLTAGIWLLECCDMGARHVADVDPKIDANRREDLVLPLSLDEVDKPLVGGVDG